MSGSGARAERCIRVWTWLGGVGGALWGLAWLAGAITGTSPGYDEQEPLWHAFAVCVPSAIIGAWVGSRAGSKACRSLTDPPHHGLVMTMLLGGALAGVVGAAAVASAFVPFFVIGDLIGAIEFWQQDPFQIALGSGVYGAAIGLLGGVAIGLFLGLFSWLFALRPR